MIPAMVVAGMLALAVLVRAPVRRRAGGLSHSAGGRSTSAGGTGGAGGSGSPGLLRERPSRGAWRLGVDRAGASTAGVRRDVGVLVTEVATRLRAGASAEAAWRATLTRAGPAVDGAEPGADGVPPALLALARRGGHDHRAAVGAAVVACRLSAELGAPLADVLDRCALGVGEAARASAARRLALAGPRSTARLLGWLPVVGAMLGAAFGANPVATLRDGSWGTACLLAGAALLLLGRRWSAALVAAAERGGGP